MITLIFCGDLKYCPYLKRYTERLEKFNIEYEVLFWNRSGAKLNLAKNYFYYDSPSSEALGNINKAFDFLKFGLWINKHLSKHKTNGLVLLSTLTGILLFHQIRKYKYIFDIRDFSFENLWIFRKIEEQVIRNSSFTCISSKGFENFLPKYEYVISHNFNRNEIPLKKEEKTLKKVIKIVWNGTIRYFDYQKKYLDVFKNDSRFELIFHGDGTELNIFKSYCKENNIYNVFFTGAYDNKDKAMLLKDADVLNNCYGGKKDNVLEHAVSNRFYDGLIYHIPQIVEPGGYKAKLISMYNVGLVLEPNAQCANNLYTYCLKLKRDKFIKYCDAALSEILYEDDIYIKKIDEFIKRN